MPFDAQTLSTNLSIVIPAFNEEAAIELTVGRLRAALPHAEIIVVDDCSSDRTGDIAAALDVVVVRHVFNQGQGASLKTGMRLATRLYVAWFDADNEHRTEDLVSMLERIGVGDLVAVIGQRGRSASWFRGAGKWLIRLVGRSLRINAGGDLNCGLRIFRRDMIVRYLPLIPDRFSASLVTTLVVIERRYPLEFMPITTNKRIGSSTVLMRDGFDAIIQLLRCVLLFAPLRFFLNFGIAMVSVGTLYSLFLSLAHGQGVPVGGMLVILLGVLLAILGLIADQISQLRLAQLPQAEGHRVWENAVSKEPPPDA